MTPDDPRHGTYAGASMHRKEGGAMCPPCREAFRRYYRRLKKQRRAGQPRTVPLTHGGALDALRAALEAGDTYSDVARRTGLHDSHINRLVTGEIKRVKADTWRAIMGLKEPLPPRLTDVGTVRRLRALHCLGWTAVAMGRESGLSFCRIKQALRGESVVFTKDSRELIAAMYDRLGTKRPPVMDRGAVAAVNRSKRNGWATSFAWDDIDDPNETPHGLPDWRSRRADPNLVDPAAVERRIAGDKSVRLNKAEATVMVRQMMDAGYTYAAIRTITGITVDKRRDGTQKRAAA